MVQKELLKRIIVESAHFIESLSRRMVPREALVLPRREGKVIVLYGLRRSGKTFMLYSLFRSSPDTSLYVDFEDDRLYDFGPSDFESLREAFYELRPEVVGRGPWFLLDEVQKVEGWEAFARRMVERGEAKVAVTGSSSKLGPLEVKSVLRGRDWTIEVLPFSFREVLRAEGMEISQDLIYGLDRAKAVHFFEEYLFWGGFPEVVLAPPEDRRKIVREYLDALFFKDLVERFEVTNLPLLKALREALFSSFASKFSLTSFFRKARGKFPFSKDTLYRYYDHFLEAMLIFEVRMFTPSPYQRLRNPPKIYLADNALALRVGTRDRGRLLENIVYLELRRRGYELHYFKGRGECDFVAVKDGQKELYQVTLALQDNLPRELEGLVEAATVLGLRRGFIITLEEERRLVDKGVEVIVVPAWKWLLAL